MEGSVRNRQSSDKLLDESISYWWLEETLKKDKNSIEESKEKTIGMRPKEGTKLMAIEFVILAIASLILFLGVVLTSPVTNAYLYTGICLSILIVVVPLFFIAEAFLDRGSALFRGEEVATSMGEQVEEYVRGSFYAIGVLILFLLFIIGACLLWVYVHPGIAILFVIVVIILFIEWIDRDEEEKYNADLRKRKDLARRKRIAAYYHHKRFGR